MKKILLLLTAVAFLATTFAASGSLINPKNANDVILPIGNNTQISLMEFSKIKIKDYEILTGKHLNLLQRISFKAGQKKLRNSISADGTVTNKNLLKALSAEGMTSGFNIGWFALGFLTGAIGVILSYLIDGEKEVKKNRQKWAWIGFGIWIVLLIIFYI